MQQALHNKKEFSEELITIQTFECLNGFQIQINGFEGSDAKLSKKGKKLYLHINQIFSDDEIHSFSFSVQNKYYLTKKASQTYHSMDIHVGVSSDLLTQFELQTIQSRGFNMEKY